MTKARTRQPAVAGDTKAAAAIAGQPSAAGEALAREFPKVPTAKAEAPQAAAPRRAAEPDHDQASGSFHHTHAQGVFVDSSFHDEFPEDWTPPAQLDAPPPRAGMVQRWVRISILGQNDGSNVALQSGQGWRPRRLSTVPGGEQSRYPSVRSARWGDVIVSGALILCETTVGVAAKMEAYYKDKRIGLVNTIRNDTALRAAVKAPKAGSGFGEVEAIERSTQVTTRRPIVASD